MDEQLQRPPAEDPAFQSQHEMADVTYTWLSARVAETEALDDQLVQSGVTGAEYERRDEEWRRQRHELEEQTLDFARQHPDRGSGLFGSLVFEGRGADKRFALGLMAEYMRLDETDGAGLYAALLLDDDNGIEQVARHQLHMDADEGQLGAGQVALVAGLVAENAKIKIQRLRASQTPPN